MKKEDFMISNKLKPSSQRRSQMRFTWSLAKPPQWLHQFRTACASLVISKLLFKISVCKFRNKRLQFHNLQNYLFKSCSLITIVLTFAFAYLSKRTMSSPPNVPQYFRLHGQMDTESETDQADVPMSSTASAVPTARWPPMDDA